MTSHRAVFAALLLASVSAFAAACTDDDPSEVPSDDGEEGDEYEPFDGGKADGAGLGGPVLFANNCTPGDRITISAFVSLRWIAAMLRERPGVVAYPAASPSIPESKRLSFPSMSLVGSRPGFTTLRFTRRATSIGASGIARIARLSAISTSTWVNFSLGFR